MQSIAKADPSDLIEKIEYLSKKVATQLIAAAKVKLASFKCLIVTYFVFKMLLLEKVENLREEAEDVLDGIEQHF